MRVALVMLLLLGCTNPPAGSSSSGGAAPASGAETVATSTSLSAGSAATAPQVTTSGPRVTFPDGFVVAVEIADEDDTRAQGLMYRDHLAAGAGMLFFFPEDGDYHFWMKNTRIPLDMIFIDKERKIVGIEHQVPPCKFDPCPSYGPDLTSRYVLEVAGGEARKHSLKNGDVLKFEGTEDVVPR